MSPSLSYCEDWCYISCQRAKWGVLSEDIHRARSDPSSFGPLTFTSWTSCVFYPVVCFDDLHYKAPMPRRASSAGVGVDLIASVALSTSSYFLQRSLGLFLNIFLPQTKAVYTNVGLRMASNNQTSFNQTSVESAWPQRIFMECLNATWRQWATMHLLSSWDFHESLPSTVIPRYLHSLLNCSLSPFRERLQPFYLLRLVKTMTCLFLVEWLASVRTPDIYFS